jgi:hypothetical protein
MLVIDGVRYEEWTPPSEEEFERVVKEHAQEIFGEKSIYLDLKRKLKSKAGIGSIPDGFVIIFGTSPHWHIIEIELSTHPLYEHIVSQVGRFIRGINNPNTQREIVNAFDEEIAKDEFLKLRLRKAIDPTEIHRFLSDRIEQNPILTIIIEKKTDELTEALNTLNYSQIKVVEFRTFVREGVDLAVHAHLFEPLYRLPSQESKLTTLARDDTTAVLTHPETRITLRDLIMTGIIVPNQSIYGLEKGKRFDATVMGDGTIVLSHDGSKHESLSTAAQAVVNYNINGWNWWRTRRKDGSECKLIELRKQLVRS